MRLWRKTTRFLTKNLIFIGFGIMVFAVFSITFSPMLFFRYKIYPEPQEGSVTVFVDSEKTCRIDDLPPFKIYGKKWLFEIISLLEKNKYTISGDGCDVLLNKYITYDKSYFFFIIAMIGSFVFVALGIIFRWEEDVL